MLLGAQRQERGHSHRRLRLPGACLAAWRASPASVGTRLPIVAFGPDDMGSPENGIEYQAPSAGKALRMPAERHDSAFAVVFGEGMYKGRQRWTVRLNTLADIIEQNDRLVRVSLRHPKRATGVRARERDQRIVAFGEGMLPEGDPSGPLHPEPVRHGLDQTGLVRLMAPPQIPT